MHSHLLQMLEIQKSFPGVKALRGVSLSVAAGEVVGLVGENGAGKSTLLRILAGEEHPDQGTIKFDDITTIIANVADARGLGIGVIHQELSLHENLDIASNLFLGREISKFGFRCTRAMVRSATVAMRRVGLNVSPRKLVGDLSLAQQQLVEIARAILTNVKLLIMDEPTSSLSDAEVTNLFRIICELKSDGVGIIYVSHRLREIETLADKVVVLRDGKNVGTLGRFEMTQERIASMMVGRDLASAAADNGSNSNSQSLQLDGWKTLTHPHASISFQIDSGEIIGLAGLVGAGRTELLRSLFGIDRAVAGTMTMAGQKVRVRAPADAMRVGICLVPEDRKEQGLILTSSIRQNIGLATLWANRFGACLLNRKAERMLSRRSMEQFAIKAASDSQLAQSLSGGNQQKIVLAKWLALKPKLLLLDEPTRGIDVGSRSQIYRLLNELAANGTSILFASNEMEELIALSHRILVMSDGALTGQLIGKERTEANILRLAMRDIRRSA